ncbi:MAG: hypothetical protein PCFJNLEI_02014 [Verrucomicrobiae bacterium]|nr:hypothetical protein [Verrucomicrobiae bacterium]
MKFYLPVVGLCLGLAFTAGAAETAPKLTPDWRLALPAPRANKFCDPVCELRSQDAAFSLLMEVYRQHQSYHIETDYQFRLQQIAELRADKSPFIIESDSEALKLLRQFVLGLVQKERELRMAKLETQVANFQAAYSCVRKIDEDYVGEKVAKNLSQSAAQEKIKDLVIITPGTLAQGDIRHAGTIPASVVLMNPPVGPVNDTDLVERCD